MTQLAGPIGVPTQESARLQALANVAGAASGGLSSVLRAIADGVRTAFGFDSVLNLYDSQHDRYVVRAVGGGGAGELLGTSSSREGFDPLLSQDFEVVPDVYFVPHDRGPDISGIEMMATPGYAWEGPGYWHPEDMCFVLMRTSQGKGLGILSVDSPNGDPLPSPEMFEVLRLFAMVGANAVENVLLMREVGDLAVEREMKALRQRLEEEVALRRSLLEIGNRLGAGSSTAPEGVFALLTERLNEVVAIRGLTIYVTDVDARSCRPIYHGGDQADAEAILEFSIPFGVGATGSVALQGTRLISNSGQAGRQAVEVPGSADIDEHLLVVPVLVEEQVKAVLTLSRLPDQPPFLPADAHRAELFAQHVASAFLLAELADSRARLAGQVEELQDLNRLKDEFVANVSHELRTPLTAIIGNVMTVAGLGDMLGQDERKELLMAAERQAKRLAELLENLLAESRLVGDDPELIVSRVDLRTFIEEVADTLRFRAGDRLIRVKAPARLDIATDRTLLYRVLFNLGDNAIKYSDGPVWLRANRDGEGVCIEVVDQGVGIAPDDIPRIFEQFEQLDGSSSRRVGGVGLGLHLCARATAALGGRIDVRSEPGRGSTFSIWLPPRGPAPH
jgi:signal transduction histidine kinase